VYQIYRDDPSQVATIIRYHSLPVLHSSGFFFSSTSSNAFELNTQRRDEKSEEEEEVQKLIVDLVDKTISCVCSMRACV